MVEWIGVKGTLYVEDAMNDVAIQSFHQKSLALAMECHQSAEQRYYNAVMISLDEQEYQEINKEIDEFTTSLLARYGSSQNRNHKKLYQVNLNNIPVTKDLIRFKRRAKELNNSLAKRESGEFMKTLLTLMTVLTMSQGVFMLKKDKIEVVMVI